jgi:hypothetical protein
MEDRCYIDKWKKKMQILPVEIEIKQSRNKTEDKLFLWDK